MNKKEAFSSNLEEKIINYLDELEEKKKTLTKKQKKLLSVKAFYKKTEESLKDYERLRLASQDKDELLFFSEEIANLSNEKKMILEQIKKIILEDENAKQNIAMELRPGTGGSEACLFTRDLYCMYAKLADEKKWRLELIETKTDIEGNFTFVSFLIKGRDVYRLLKNESGIHRVQRVPKTESKGRVHTSTISVVVLPEPSDDIELNIRPQDLKIDAYCAGGAGGQHVNKTSSAIRITHLPTGIVSTSQDSRDQHANKEKALFVLKTRILEKKRKEKEKEIGDLRSSSIGNSERSEKIRTYNWQQNRVTDHRLGISWNKLDLILAGDCCEILEKLTEYEIENKIINRNI